MPVAFSATFTETFNAFSASGSGKTICSGQIASTNRITGTTVTIYKIRSNDGRITNPDSYWVYWNSNIDGCEVGGGCSNQETGISAQKVDDTHYKVCVNTMYSATSVYNFGGQVQYTGEPLCTPTTEICNGADDDCDGQYDEGLTPPSRTCSAGIGACYMTGSEFKTCNGLAGWSTAYSGCTASAGSPSTEVCNGIDDNCNNQIDDNLIPPSQSCSRGTGACSRTGTEYKTCNGVSGWSSTYYGCTAIAGLPSTEICNGIDDDCDDQTDEGLIPPSQTCSRGAGACFSTGTEYKTCNGASGWSSTFSGCTALIISPGSEICNGIDDDCDSQTDEELTQPTQSCSAGIGACYRTGLEFKTCNGASGWSSTFSGCNVVAGTPVTEKCNNIDDDCDGLTDEDCDIDGDGFVKSPSIYPIECVGSYRDLLGNVWECIPSRYDCKDDDVADKPGVSVIANACKIGICAHGINGQQNKTCTNGVYKEDKFCTLDDPDDIPLLYSYSITTSKDCELFNLVKSGTTKIELCNNFGSDNDILTCKTIIGKKLGYCMLPCSDFFTPFQIDVSCTDPAGIGFGTVVDGIQGIDIETSKFYSFIPRNDSDFGSLG